MLECLAGRSRLELITPSPRRLRQFVVGAKQLLVVNVRGITGVVVHAGTFGDRTRQLIGSIVRMHYSTVQGREYGKATRCRRSHESR